MKQEMDRRENEFNRERESAALLLQESKAKEGVSQATRGADKGATAKLEHKIRDLQVWRRELEIRGSLEI